mgnify:CR=1 FL=1
MKIFITLFVLFFSSSLSAEDISDFQIEGINIFEFKGMSIGDSLLDYFSEEEINQNKSFYPDSKRFFRLTRKIANMELYDTTQFHVKSNDKNYTIYSISGLIFLCSFIIKSKYFCTSFFCPGVSFTDIHQQFLLFWHWFSCPQLGHILCELLFAPEVVLSGSVTALVISSVEMSFKPASLGWLTCLFTC